MKITAVPNTALNGFTIPNDYQKAQLHEWLKKYKRFEIVPVSQESVKARHYLHGAVEPTWAQWQYNIDPREQGLSDSRHYLFMRDFNYSIVKDRKGNLQRVPQTSRGKVFEILEAYTAYATENGAPIPNVELYKTYRDKWSMDIRFPTFYDWLEFLHLDVDAMPSDETLAQLEVVKKPIYQDDYKEPTI